MIKFKIIIFQLVLILIPFLINAQSNNLGENGSYGKWITDDKRLPAFEANLEEHPLQWHPFSHLMGTGHVMVLANQWGAINLFGVGEDGMVNFTPSIYTTRGGFYPMFETNGKLYSLIYSELDSNKSITYGIGYATYQGEMNRDNVHLKVIYTIRTAFDYSKGYYIHVNIENLNEKSVSGRLMVRSDTWPRQNYCNFQEWVSYCNSLQINASGVAVLKNVRNLGDILLVGNNSYTGTSVENVLELSKNIRLISGDAESAYFFMGYDDNYERKAKDLAGFNEKDYQMLQKSWDSVLEPVKFNLPEKWMEDECIWSYSQLLGFCFYDRSTDEYVTNLGGYGLGEVTSLPGSGFSIREMGETSLVFSYFNPELAKSAIRWMSKLQITSGDIFRFHLYKPIVKLPRDSVFNGKFPNESDSEIWFLLAIGEYIKTTGDYDFLNEEVDFMTFGESGTIWDHAKAAFHFVFDYIKTGDHGLIRIMEGDWNDYLSKIGHGANGESVMNTGIMSRALESLENIAGKLNDFGFQQEMKIFHNSLLKAGSAAFNKEWFIRGYDDAGKALGPYGDRVFLNAQTWSVLGNFGNDRQKQTALHNMVSYCTSDIGMLLMSKPFTSPAPKISWSPIESGEGENAGIWPQTVHWGIWALAENGKTKMAMEEWKKMTLRNHYEKYSDVPFGIINGPDCYSSYFSGKREGWTQTGIFNRILEIPMNPIVAWQAFSMKKILENQ